LNRLIRVECNTSHSGGVFNCGVGHPPSAIHRLRRGCRDRNSH
jgi:hypothetical protein